MEHRPFAAQCPGSRGERIGQCALGGKVFCRELGRGYKEQVVWGWIAKDGWIFTKRDDKESACSLAKVWRSRSGGTQAVHSHES
jgi:hypothetical protein